MFSKPGTAKGMLIFSTIMFTIVAMLQKNEVKGDLYLTWGTISWVGFLICSHIDAYDNKQKKEE